MSTPTRNATTHGTTVRAVIAESLRTAARTSDTKAPPLAVLWPDPDRTWEPAVRSLQEALPVLVLGEWDGAVESARGPALWLRAVLAAPDMVTLPAHLATRDQEHPEKTPWVLYLPGVHRHELTDLGQVPEHLAPLADVALRSAWWTSPSGQVPWAPHSFLGSKHGARLDLAGDARTRTVLAQVLPDLLGKDVDALREQGRLDAARLNAWLVPDAIRRLLEWIDDSTATRALLTVQEWAAFAEQCASTYGIDPVKDTPISAAARLGARAGGWAAVWDRFVEAPGRYPGLRVALDQARPPVTLLAEDPHPDSWPSWNHEQEDLLRSDLSMLGDQPGDAAARDRLRSLAAEHASRQDSVWGELGEAPLAVAVAVLGHLVASLTDLTAGTVAEAATWYADHGHTIDRLALEAVAATQAEADRAAVLAALHAVYDLWADRTARTFQDLVRQHGYHGATGLNVESGTCVVYVDALRVDLAHRLTDRLTRRHVNLTHRLSAFPSLTPTGQPAVVPLSTEARAVWAGGADFDVSDGAGRALKGAPLASALTAAGIQTLGWESGETGDVSGIAWTQTNDIDSAGHATKGARFETVVDGLLDRVATRIDALLDAGWRRVVVVTDHGFLLPAHPAPKVELPLAVTDGGSTRKPRVARLRDGAPAQEFPTVPWTWDRDVAMVSAPGTSAFEAGVRYTHGGLSLQECVVPVIAVAASAPSGIEGALTDVLADAARLASTVQIIDTRWTGLRCRVDVAPPLAGIAVELRLAPGDAGSTIGGPTTTNEDGEARLLVADDDDEGAPAYVVVLRDDGTVTAQRQTTVGGDR